MQPNFDDTQIAFAHKSDGELRKAQLLFASFGSQWVVQRGSAIGATLVRLGVPGTSLAVKHTVYAQFCGGESLAECGEAVESLAKGGVQAILDYSVEGEKTEASFDATERELLANIEWSSTHKAVAFSVFKVTGLARFELLAKRTAGTTFTADEEAEWARVHARVSRICERAHTLGVPVFIDGEETWIQGAIDALADEMMATHNGAKAVVYNTYQMYRKDSLARLQAAFKRAEQGKFFLGAKLVRGAYLEKERRHAAETGTPDPMQPDKAATDADYDRALLFCLDHIDRMGLCAGTHNEASSMLLVRELERRHIAPDDARVYFSQLYGMSDNISFNLARAGYRVAKYLPYGPVKSVLPYLVRRAQENTAIAGQGGRELRFIEKELKRRKQQR